MCQTIVPLQFRFLGYLLLAAVMMFFLVWYDEAWGQNHLVPFLHFIYDLVGLLPFSLIYEPPRRFGDEPPK